MASRKRSASFSDQAVSPKKPCMDDIIAALELQHALDFPTDAAKKRNVKIYNNQLWADKLEIRNSKQSLILQLPLELLRQIYEYVLDDQVFRVKAVDGKARLASSTHAHPLAILHTCRKLHRDLATYPYATAVFQITTFRFASLFDTWRILIHSNVGAFVRFVKSLPNGIKLLEVVGVEKGFQAYQRMRLERVLGHKSLLSKRPRANYEAEVKRYVRMAYPKAVITTRVVKSMRQG